MTLVHIVLFEFKPSVESEVIQDVCQFSATAGQSARGSPKLMIQRAEA